MCFWCIVDIGFPCGSCSFADLSALVSCFHAVRVLYICHASVLVFIPIVDQMRVAVRGLSDRVSLHPHFYVEEMLSFS